MQPSSAMDGVVIYHESLPGGNADFGTDAVYNEGDTLTHEAGHWLSLYHTFQGGCSKKNDQVDRHAGAGGSSSFDCDRSRTRARTMAGADPIHNFMDYARRPLHRPSSRPVRRRGCRRTGTRCANLRPGVEELHAEQGQRRHERDDQRVVAQRRDRTSCFNGDAPATFTVVRRRRRSPPPSRPAPPPGRSRSPGRTARHQQEDVHRRRLAANRVGPRATGAPRAAHYP